ncbi:MAG: flavoprotein, family [Firmicutes bacterium]|nr:flavoprotein, family [Bacillota bacterium]
MIGGGAAGIAAAIASKDMGIDAAIIEGSDRIGKKLLSTGNGRCNITNTDINPDRYHSENPSFPENILGRFGYNDTVDFFSLLGLPLTTLDGGKAYPLSLQASSVLDILRLSLEERGLPVYLNSKVKEVKPTKKGFRLLTNGGDVFECSRLIICCGGKSFPTSGSDGSGFTLAKQLGHSIVRPIPSLVQLKLRYDHLKAVSGVKFDGYAKVISGEGESRQEYGEILFTDYGISGPPVLQLSRKASYALSRQEAVSIVVDMMPGMTLPALGEFLENHFATFSYRSVMNSLIGIANKKLIPIILREAGIRDIHKPCCELTVIEKKKLYGIMKAWSFEVYDTNSFKNAQVTAGGIDTREVSADTLESKLVPHLYFAGEVLDVDADCGGFNLQWAWASGYIAAMSSAKK